MAARTGQDASLELGVTPHVTEVTDAHSGLISMNCNTLAETISQLQPELSPTDVARLCLLILTQIDDPDTLTDEAVLRKAWRNASFRLEAATDQHAAVSQELNEMCADGPIQFTPDQLWILLRAVKVQSQILELYTEEAVLA